MIAKNLWIKYEFYNKFKIKIIINSEKYYIFIKNTKI